MDRRLFLSGLLAVPAFAACAKAASTSTATLDSLVGQPRPGRLVKSTAQWRRLLNDDQYHVMFEAGTERPGTSTLLDEHRAGTFTCAACANPLFASDAKFESGTGWPSFFRPMRGAVAFERDASLGMVRSEYHCARCGAHQGHVFDDGPRPTGQRFCNNGVALAFTPRGSRLPALRT